MKKRKALIPLSLLALAMVGLAACAGTSSDSSSSEPVSSSQATVTSITISNADALQAEWHVGGDDRSMTIVTDPAINIQSALNSGALTITSSDTSVVSVAGRMLSPVGVGEATITVAYGDVRTTLDLVVYTSAYILPSDDVVVVGGTVSFGLAANTSTLTPSSLTWTSSDTTIATVSNAGVVTGVKAGSVTITGTIDGDYPIYSSYTLTVSESAVSYTNCGDIKAAGTYIARGKVVASYSSGFFFDDGTGVGWTYKSGHGLSVGDYVKVSGSVTQYHNLYEFGSSSTITPIIDTTIVPQEEKEGYAITELTPSNAEATLVKATTSTKVKWTSIAGLAGSDTTLNLAGYAGVAIETVSNSYADSIETGKVYEIEGYFAGYSSSSGGYCQICITKLTEVTPTTAIIQLESYAETAYLPETAGGTVSQITVDVDFYSPNSSTPTVASDAEAVATATYADGVVTITPVAAGTANVTVTVDGVSQTIAVTVNQMIATTKLSEISASGEYRVVGKVMQICHQGFLIDDGSAGIYVYDQEADVDVGDVVDITGTVALSSSRSNWYLRLTPSFYADTSESVTVTTATELTGTEAQSLYTSIAAGTIVAKGLYSATVTCTGLGYNNLYPMFDLSGGPQLEALRWSSTYLSIEADKEYDITFYVTGYYDSYLGITLVSATAKDAGPSVSFAPREASSGTLPTESNTDTSTWTCTLGTAEIGFTGYAVRDLSNYGSLFMNSKGAAAVSYFYNTDALSFASSIESVKITTGSGASGSAIYNVTFGTSAVSTAVEASSGQNVAKASSYTFTNTTEGATFFQIASTNTSANGQIASVEIAYTAAA